MAEYFATAWDNVFPLPDGISSRTAIATLIPGQCSFSHMDLLLADCLITAGATALPLATEAYNVRASDYVLVHTVAGSVGLFLAQLVKSRGGIVIGTTSTAEKAAIAKANGADHVILYKSENVAQRVLEITSGQGVHAIFDGVGQDT